MRRDHDTLIDLKSFPGKAHDSRFIALYCNNPPDSDAIFCLTPHVMQWSEHFYLFDLQSCINYWNQQASRLGISLFELYKKILQSVFSDRAIAVCCAHPWQGLFFLYGLVDDNSPGVYVLNSLFNKKAYRKLGWKHWFAALSDLAVHLEAIKVKNFTASRLRTKIAQMQHFVRRLDLSGPYALEQAEVAAIRRRYSGWVGEAWAWTFLSEAETAATNSSAGSRADYFSAGFPWRALKFQDLLQVKRHLDYPVSQWDVVEPLLQEDFARLCQQGCWSPNDKINCLHWHITLFNLEQVQVDIRFRNPYSLHKDGPEFKTALYQAYYAYVAMMQALTQRDTDLDLPGEMPFVSWHIVIEQRLHLPPVVLDMFENDRAGAGHERILDLQNCLPEAIEHYTIAPDFMPEQLFRQCPPGHDEACDFSLKQWSQVALARPLFYYPQPRPLHDVDAQQLSGRSCQFLERTAYNWWRSENINDLVRDYFLWKDRQGRYVWIFRNNAGEWYQHGIYS